MTKKHQAVLVLAALSASLAVKDSLENHTMWPEIVMPKPLGNERTGKRKSGKSRYEPPKFG